MRGQRRDECREDALFMVVCIWWRGIIHQGCPLQGTIHGGWASGSPKYDDVIKWKHFPRYWPFVGRNPPVTGGFPPHRPVTRSFYVCFELRFNKRFGKRSRRRWFDTPSHSLWRHCNGDISCTCIDAKYTAYATSGDNIHEAYHWHSRVTSQCSAIALQWRHNGRGGVSNHQSPDCLFNRLFRRRSKKTSKLCVTGLCEGNSPVTGEFPTQRTSNAENVSIWWRHYRKWGTRGFPYNENTA